MILSSDIERLELITKLMVGARVANLVNRRKREGLRNKGSGRERLGLVGEVDRGEEREGKAIINKGKVSRWWRWVQYTSVIKEKAVLFGHRGSGVVVQSSEFWEGHNFAF